MGTSKPLTIGVDSRYAGEPWVVELEAKGHNIILRNLAEYDLVLGPTCCRFLPGMEGFLASVVKGARAIKFPKEKE